MQPTALLETALAVVRSGISIVPVATDKNPRFDLLPPKDQHSSTWKPYRERLPTSTEVEYWHQHGAQFAMVCGALGDLIAIDFDDASFYDRFITIADVGNCVIQRSGGRGYHLLFRTKLHVKPEGLAYVPADNVAKRSVVIETRGVGNVIGMAPSLHHSGRYYEVLHGDLGNIPYVDDTTVQTLLATARAMTEVEVPVFQPSPRVQRPYLNGDASVIDTFNQRHTIRDELEAAGYVPRTARGYVRPGGQNPTVEVYDDSNTAYHFNTNDPLFGVTDPFKVWMHARGYSDFTSAVREAASLMDMKPVPKPSMVPPISQPAPQTQASVSPLTTAPTTEYGNAECFEAMHALQFRYNRNAKKWLWWTGQRWQSDSNAEAIRAMLEVVRQRRREAININDPDHAQKLVKFSFQSESAKALNASLGLAGYLPSFNTTMNDYDTNRWLLGVQNGVLDLKTQTLRPAEPADMITMQADVSYDASATCPRWRQFLIEVFNNDTELIKYIQRVAGYCLTGDTREQKMFILYGDGNNGKSVFLGTLNSLLGDYAAVATFNTFDAERRNEATNDLAALKGRRFVMISETNADKRLDEAKVKQVTGDPDQITCRFLYQEPFTYSPEFKIVMATNHLPLIRNTDNGIWRRLIPVPFLQNFAGREDRNLIRTLAGEMSGILNWALEGLHDWLQHGLGTAEHVEQSKASYRSNSDIVGQFLDERYIKANGHDDWQTANKLYKDFENWSISRGEKPMTSTSFGRILAGKGFLSERRVVGTSKVTVYLGLRERSTTDE